MFRALTFAALMALAVPFACGGRVIGGGGSGSGNGGGSGGGGGSATGGSTGSGGSSGTTAGSGGSGGSPTMTCVDVNLSDYDVSCNTASDCTVITTGMLCTGSCECGGATINRSDLPKYQASVAPIAPGVCPCPSSGSPKCVAGTCNLCLDPSTPGCEIEAGAPVEAGSDAEVPSSITCTQMSGSVLVCFMYSQLTPSEEPGVASTCTAGGGKLAPTCSTTDLSACCTDITERHYTYGYCYYDVAASELPVLKSVCGSSMGTWSP